MEFVFNFRSNIKSSEEGILNKPIHLTSNVVVHQAFFSCERTFGGHSVVDSYTSTVLENGISDFGFSSDAKAIDCRVVAWSKTQR